MWSDHCLPPYFYYSSLTYSSHADFIPVLWPCQAHSFLRAFICAVSTAWNTLLTQAARQEAITSWEHESRESRKKQILYTQRFSRNNVGKSRVSPFFPWGDPGHVWSQKWRLTVTLVQRCWGCLYGRGSWKYSDSNDWGGHWGDWEHFWELRVGEKEKSSRKVVE